MTWLRNNFESAKTPVEQDTSPEPTAPEPAAGTTPAAPVDQGTSSADPVGGARSHRPSG